MKYWPLDVSNKQSINMTRKSLQTIYQIKKWLSDGHTNRYFATGKSGGHGWSRQFLPHSGPPTTSPYKLFLVKSCRQCSFTYKERKLVDWLVFSTNISSISATSWREERRTIKRWERERLINVQSKGQHVYFYMPMYSFLGIVKNSGGTTPCF